MNCVSQFGNMIIHGTSVAVFEFCRIEQMKLIFSAAFLAAVCAFFGPANEVVDSEQLAAIAGAQNFPVVIGQKPGGPPKPVPPCNRITTQTQAKCAQAGGCDQYTLFKYNSAPAGGTNTALLRATNTCADWPEPGTGWTPGVDANGDGDFDDPGDTPPVPTNPCTGTAVDESVTLQGTPKKCI